MPFEIRGINVCESLSRHTRGQVETLLERVAGWKMNTLQVLPEYGFRPHERLIREFCSAHDIDLVQYIYSFLAFTPKASLDTFAVDPSGCPHRARMECETRLCSVSKAAREQFREGARRYLGEYTQPGDQLLLATPDGMLLCACENCRGLNAIEQWQPFLEIALEEIQRCGKAVKTHFIAYVGRFRLPSDMSVFEKIDAVMFDTHLRHRWLPLGMQHSIGLPESLEGKNDPEALDMPMNIYLLDRIREWRAAYSGKLYVFENLMIQGCFSLPQPNTPALLQDLETFRDLKLDGIVYEAFEPGIGAFVEQFDTLSKAMLGEVPVHCWTPLERIAQQMDAARAAHTRVLSYLFEPACLERENMERFLGSPVLVELAMRIRDFLAAPRFELWKKIAAHAIANREALDWIYITYRLATYLPEEERPQPLSPAQEKVFLTAKPWDYLDGEADPQHVMTELVESFLARDLSPVHK